MLHPTKPSFTSFYLSKLTNTLNKISCYFTILSPIKNKKKIEKEKETSL